MKAEIFHTSEEVLELILENLIEIKHSLKNPAQPKTIPLYYDNVEVCQMLHITQRTLSSWRKKKQIQYFKIGNRIYYERAYIENLKALRQASKP